MTSDVLKHIVLRGDSVIFDRKLTQFFEKIRRIFSNELLTIFKVDLKLLSDIQNKTSMNHRCRDDDVEYLSLG